MRGFGGAVAVQLFASALCGPAAAQDSDLALIAGQSFRSAQGGITLNVASGDANQQLNGAALNAGGGPAFFLGQQHGEMSAGRLSVDVAAVMILDQAFAGAQGMTLVNLASGDANLQANAVAIAVGVEAMALADVALSQTRSDPEPEPPAPDGDRPNRTAFIGEFAFREAAGIIQVNATAGSRNNSANSFTLTTPFGPAR